MEPYGDWAEEDQAYLYDRGLVAGAAQRVLALVINLWGALDRKREMPIVPATPQVYFRDQEGQVWALSSELPSRFNPTAYEWDTRPAITGKARLLWPVCERLGAVGSRLGAALNSCPCA